MFTSLSFMEMTVERRDLNENQIKKEDNDQSNVSSISLTLKDNSYYRHFKCQL